MVSDLAPAEVHLVAHRPGAAGPVHRELAGEHQEPRHHADGRLRPHRVDRRAPRCGTGAPSTSAACSSDGRRPSRPSGCTCCRCPVADAPRREIWDRFAGADRRRPGLRGPDPELPERLHGRGRGRDPAPDQPPPRRLQLRHRPRHLHPHLPRRRAAGAAQRRPVLARRGADRGDPEAGPGRGRLHRRPGVPRDRGPRLTPGARRAAERAGRRSRSPTARWPRSPSSWPPRLLHDVRDLRHQRRALREELAAEVAESERLQDTGLRGAVVRRYPWLRPVLQRKDGPPLE